jgi:hypothetical protein
LEFHRSYKNKSARCPLANAIFKSADLPEQSSLRVPARQQSRHLRVSRDLRLGGCGRIVESLNGSLWFRDSGLSLPVPSPFTSPTERKTLMSTPWVPSYFGSWEELVRSLLHNPFLGSGIQHPLHAYFQQRPPHIGPPDPGPLDVASFLNPGVIAALNPQPLPPRAITSLFLAQLSVKDITSRLPKDQGAELTSGLEQTIADEIDFVCGNVPHIHGPIPGPSPFPFAVAAELNLIGNTLQEGTLRASVLQLAGQIISKATTPVTARKESRAAA